MIGGPPDEEFEALRAEFREKVIGARIDSFLLSLCKRVSENRYPSRLFNEGRPWQPEEHRNLANDVVIEQLLHEHRQQLTYVFETAHDLPSLERLVSLQIRRTLLRRLRITQIDRLLKRTRALADDGHFDLDHSSSNVVYRLVGSDHEYRPLRPSMISRCVMNASSVPRLYNQAMAEKESKIYSTDDLKTVVEIVLTCGNAVSEAEFREIFGNLLTPWTATRFESFEGDSVTGFIVDDSPIEDELMMNAAVEFTDRLSPDERVVLLFKFQNQPDTAVAEALNVSRPTAIDRKKAVFARMKVELLDDLDSSDHPMAIRVVAERISSLMEGDSDD